MVAQDGWPNESSSAFNKTCLSPFGWGCIVQGVVLPEETLDCCKASTFFQEVAPVMRWHKLIALGTGLGPCCSACLT